MIKKALLAACVGSLVACAVGPVEDLGTTGQSIIKGKASDASEDAVVLIFYYDPTSGTGASCTGTLLTSKLVLTARHCVSKTDESAACDSTGKTLAGGVVYSDHPPADLYIFTGPKSPDFNSPTVTPDALGKKIVTDGSKTLCNHDVGLIELDREITNGKIMPIRLDSDAAKGDVITAIGWGVTDTSTQPSVRQQRSGVAIQAVGPADTSGGPVSPNEFQVGESICSGDSGGPAVSAAGTLVGVVSRGGNGVNPGGNPAVACDGPNAENLYTKPSPFKDLIIAAATELGQEVWVEGQPDPRLAKDGGTCAADADCQSGHCYNGKTCAADCTTDACASGYTCNADKLCIVKPVVTTVTKSGCAVSGAPGASSSSDAGLVGGLVAFGLALGARRKKRAA